MCEDRLHTTHTGIRHTLALDTSIRHMQWFVATQHCCSREQLVQCREHIAALLTQCLALERQLSQEESVSAKGLLAAQLSRTRSELGREREVEGCIREALRGAEVELLDAEVCLGMCDGGRGALERGEGAMRRMRSEQAVRRLQQQRRAEANACRTRGQAQRCSH